MRFHPTRGSMSLSEKDGGLPPDSVVQDDDEILADSERLVAQHHDRAWGAMVRIALAPCSPFSVTPELMRATAELAERLDVRLHTHLAEDPDEDRFAEEAFGRRTIEQFEEVGWGSDRAWVAHCIYPNADEIARLGKWGTGVAHCPSSNMLIGGGGIAPVPEFRAAGVPVGLGCDGSASTDSASLWMEARNALLLGRLRDGPDLDRRARRARDRDARVGRVPRARRASSGSCRSGAAGDLVCWPLEGVAFAGALTDPVEAWLRCGPVAARHTVVHGRPSWRTGGSSRPARRRCCAAIGRSARGSRAYRRGNGERRSCIRGGRVIDPAAGRDEIADVLDRATGASRRSARTSTRRPTRRWSTRRACSSRPGSSTSTCTCTRASATSACIPIGSASTRACRP